MTQAKILARLPGRARLWIPGLYLDAARAHGVERAVAGLRGVRKVFANAATGRVLIEFEPREVALEAILGAAEAAAPAPPPRARRTDDHEPGLVASLVRLGLSGALLGGIVVHRLLAGAALFASTPVVGLGSLATLVAGYPIFRRGLQALLQERRADMDTLISSATFASLLMRESLTGLVVVWLINLGDLLQALTLRRSRQAIRDLLSVSDPWVWVLASGQEVRIALAELQVGDLLAVHEGEKIAADGVVVDGEAAVNQATITGEALPVARAAGDRVFAGTVIEAGRLVVRATAVGEDTTVARIIQRVEEAREHRAPIQSAADHFSEHFVPWSFALAATVYLLTHDFRRALSMLVIACPCAAGLSTPTAIGAAIGNAAKRGILIKGGLYLESAGRLDALVFDKTGTLTTGTPRIARLVPANGVLSADVVLGLAAAAERHSHHPYAVALQRYAEQRGVVAPPANDYENLVGLGVRARVNGSTVTVGSKHLLARLGHPIPDTALDAEDSVLWVIVDDHLAGTIGLEEEVRGEAPEAVAALREVGMQHLVVATGDRGAAARRIAGEMGLEEFHGGVLPEDKLAIIRALQADGHQVAMVGDGINDAPALAAADVGIAMGTAGTDVAIETADIALASDDLRQVAGVIRLSRHTLDVVHANYATAIGVNLVGIGLSALGLLSPVMGAIVHNLSTIAVVLHSARLVTYRDGRRQLPAAVDRK